MSSIARPPVGKHALLSSLWLAPSAFTSPLGLCALTFSRPLGSSLDSRICPFSPRFCLTLSRTARPRSDIESRAASESGIPCRAPGRLALPPFPACLLADAASPSSLPLSRSTLPGRRWPSATGRCRHWRGSDEQAAAAQSRSVMPLLPFALVLRTSFAIFLPRLTSPRSFHKHADEVSKTAPRRFLIDVEETMRLVLEQEDTDGDFQVRPHTAFLTIGQFSDILYSAAPDQHHRLGSQNHVPRHSVVERAQGV